MLVLCWFENAEEYSIDNLDKDMTAMMIIPVRRSRQSGVA